MSANYPELEAAVLELPPAERMTLAERILESLPAEVPEVIEQQWIVEAERRWQRYRSGQATTIDADEVFARLERRGT
jgi:putative addiction module component (TIGR02574 family)